MDEVRVVEVSIMELLPISRDVFFALAQLSGLAFSCAAAMVRLEALVFLLLDSRYEPLDGLDAWLGLWALVEPTVAEMGIRGGGMLSCRAWLELLSIELFEWWWLLFEALRFQDKLSFRLKVLIEPGVWASSGLDTGGGDLAGLSGICARRPVGFDSGVATTLVLSSNGSALIMSPLVLDLAMFAPKLLSFLGADEERNGETVALRDRAPSGTSGTESDELAVSAEFGLPAARLPWTVLLLRGFVFSGSLSRWPREKKVALAVIGVVGVLATIRGGGVALPCLLLEWSLSAAIFAAVGVLRGPRLMGGSRRGARFFLVWPVTMGFASRSDPTALLEALVFLALGLLCTVELVSNEGALDTVPVELLRMLPLSRLYDDFFFSMKASSAGESLGDS
jgi:hypothetical protein